MNRLITFNKTGYDPFIDFIKAYAIICVLIGHTFPYPNYWGYGLWAGMQVPLFVLVQTFHCLKKSNTSFNAKKIFWRVLVPFLIVQLFLFIVILLGGNNVSFFSLVKDFLKSGGCGPGSYFPWVFIQLAFLIPLVNKYLFFNSSRIKIIVLSLGFSELFELLASFTQLPEWLYRLLAVRYVFLLYLGWVWVKDGIVISQKTLVLTCLSMASVVYFEYFSINDEPFFFKTLWTVHRWPCYYYVAVGLGGVLFVLFKLLSKSKKFLFIIKTVARCSYEIFLIQMLVIVLIRPFAFSDSIYGNTLVIILIVFVSSLIGGYYFEKYYSLFLKKVLLNHGLPKDN